MLRWLEHTHKQWRNDMDMHGGVHFESDVCKKEIAVSRDTELCHRPHVL